MTKLRYGLTAILILMTIALAGNYYLYGVEEEDALRAFERLNYDEQAAVVKYFDLLPSSDARGFLGWLIIAAEIGLIIATWKVWHAKEILGVTHKRR